MFARYKDHHIIGSDQHEKMIRDGFVPIVSTCYSFSDTIDLSGVSQSFKLETMGGFSADLGGGGIFSSTKRYMYKKVDDNIITTPSGWKDISDSITDLQVINLDSGEKIPPEYIPLCCIGPLKSGTLKLFLNMSQVM